MSPKKCSSLLSLNKSVESHVKPVVRPVTVELEKGHKIRRGSRIHGSSEKINPIYVRQKGEKPKKNRRNEILWKIVHPEPPKPKKCCHANNIILDREILTREEHRNVLSTPRKSLDTRPPSKKEPKNVPRSIPPMTIRMNILSQPKKRDVIQTWQTHAKILNGKQIDKFHKIVAESSQVMDNKKVFGLLKQWKKDENLRQKYKKREIKKLRKEIEEIRLNEIRQMIWRVFNEAREFLFDPQFYQLSEKMSGVFEKVHGKIRKMVKHEKNDPIMEWATKLLANKIAAWAEVFLKSASYERTEDFDIESVESEFEGYAIDDFILDGKESFEEVVSELLESLENKSTVEIEAFQELIESLLKLAVPSIDVIKGEEIVEKTVNIGDFEEQIEEMTVDSKESNKEDEKSQEIETKTVSSKELTEIKEISQEKTVKSKDLIEETEKTPEMAVDSKESTEEETKAQEIEKITVSSKGLEEETQEKSVKSKDLIEEEEKTEEIVETTGASKELIDEEKDETV